MAILSRFIPSLRQSDEPAEKTEDELKAERIKFHRRAVRNGPVKFSSPTTGQLRRQRHRDLKAAQRKQVKQARKQHFEARRELAALRGYLQAAGMLPYADCHEVDHDTRYRALNWIVGNFADEIQTDDDGVVTTETLEGAQYAAWRRFLDLGGVPVEA